MPVIITDVQIAFAAGAFCADLGAPLIEAAKAESDSGLDQLYERFMLRSLAYAGIFLGLPLVIWFIQISKAIRVAR